jgi:hypothetical protein
MVTEKKRELFSSGIPPLIHFYLWKFVYHLENQFNLAFQFIFYQIIIFWQCVWGVWVCVLKGFNELRFPFVFGGILPLRIGTVMSCVFFIVFGVFATV